eukprot:scaffold79037_cov43-Phaeocystis_antarctica.AAC.1
MRAAADQPAVSSPQRGGNQRTSPQRGHNPNSPNYNPNNPNPRAPREQHSRLRPIARALVAAHSSECLFGESSSATEAAE